jgi:hypothetical protein
MDVAMRPRKGMGTEESKNLLEQCWHDWPRDVWSGGGSGYQADSSTEAFRRGQHRSSHSASKWPMPGLITGRPGGLSFAKDRYAP